jgi:hypothetical protein
MYDHSPRRDVAHVLASPLIFIVCSPTYLILLMMVICGQKSKRWCANFFMAGTASELRRIGTNPEPVAKQQR